MCESIPGRVWSVWRMLVVQRALVDMLLDSDCRLVIQGSVVRLESFVIQRWRFCVCVCGHMTTYRKDTKSGLEGQLMSWYHTICFEKLEEWVVYRVLFLFEHIFCCLPLICLCFYFFQCPDRPCPAGTFNSVGGNCFTGGLSRGGGSDCSCTTCPAGEMIDIAIPFFSIHVLWLGVHKCDDQKYVVPSIDRNGACVYMHMYTIYMYICVLFSYRHLYIYIHMFFFCFNLALLTTAWPLSVYKCSSPALLLPYSYFTYIIYIYIYSCFTFTCRTVCIHFSWYM